MKLPNLESAHIPSEKITGYILNLGHEDGGGKAIFFIHFGFSLDQWQDLATALLEHASMNEITKQEKTPFGIRYVIEGKFPTPIGRVVQLRSVWFIGENNEIPRNCLSVGGKI